jgi:hypothetical protein
VLRVLVNDGSLVLTHVQWLEIERFDDQHQKLLEALAPEKFTILHQMAVHIHVRKGILIDGETL